MQANHPSIWPATDEAITRAADALRRGELVAFPTETVYGLGGDATSAAAVRGIFETKGRPTGHPLIVHLPNAEHLDQWCASVDERISRLAAAFWPGPLTLIVPRHAQVLDAVTGALPTVGLRIPSHPVALRLLDAAGRGIAAPSANRFGRVSPTVAEHVATEFEFAGASTGKLVGVLDGGPCEVGVESTIVDATDPHELRLLRPGAILAEAIELATGCSVSRPAEPTVRAPGQHESHYAPRARIELAESAETAWALAREAAHRGVRCGVWSSGAPAEDARGGVFWLDAGNTVDAAARTVYGTLRRADEMELDILWTVLPPAKGVGLALRDRLRRASAPRVSSH